MFKDFGRRLERGVKRIVKKRTEADVKKGAKGIEVKVLKHKMQRFAVWFGGSILAQMPKFGSMCHTKEQYEEIGPSIARHNVVMSSL